MHLSKQALEIIINLLEKETARVSVDGNTTINDLIEALTPLAPSQLKETMNPILAAVFKKDDGDMMKKVYQEMLEQLSHDLKLELANRER